MIEGARRMIRVNSNSQQEPEIPINPATKRHFELEIETLQNAPRDEDNLRQLLKLKEKENEQEATHIEDTQRLVTEIEMLKVVLHLVSRKSGSNSS
jgi:hypothetical protein